MKIFKNNILMIFIIGVATCYIKSETKINLTEAEETILRQMDPNLPELAKENDSNKFIWRLNQFRDVFEYIKPETIFTGVKEALFEFNSLLNLNYDKFRSNYLKIKPDDKDHDSMVKKLVEEIVEKIKKDKEKIKADAQIFKNILTKAFGKSNEEPQKPTSTPAPSPASTPKPLSSANSSQDFIDQLTKAITDRDALNLLTSRNSLDFMRHKIEDSRIKKNPLSFLIDKDFFDSAKWLVEKGADLNTRESENYDYSSFMVAVERLTNQKVKNNENLLNKAIELCNLMVRKGGNIEDARKNFDQGVLKLEPHLKQFFEAHDAPKDPLAKKLFDLKNALSSLKIKLSNLKNKLEELKRNL